MRHNPAEGWPTDIGEPRADEDAAAADTELAPGDLLPSCMIIG
jgi:hypothetical protein